MIDIHNESLIPFRSVPDWCEGHVGTRIHPSTTHRWRIKGVRGIKLETLLIGGSRITSEEALARFFHRTTAAADGDSYPSEFRADVDCDIASEQFLDEEGF